jgi:hypothetical protein
MNSVPDVFDKARDAMRRNGRRLVEHFLPGGKWDHRGEYWTCSPLRPDKTPGSFSINEAGPYKDFSTNDSGDFIDLLSKAHKISTSEAARLIVEAGGTAKATTATPGKSEKKDKAKPAAVFPQPPAALKVIEKYTSLKWFKENQGAVSSIWEYKDIDGKPQYYTARCEHSEGKKVVPLYYATDGKAYMGNPVKAPRPLYNCHKIKSSEKILIVEGEKCADVQVPGFTLITWPGGTGQVQYADWSKLHGKDVVVWPDHDEPGRKAAQYIAGKIPGAEILDVNGKPEKWDIADAEDEGLDIPAFISSCPRLHEKPTLDASCTDLVKIVNDAWQAIEQANHPHRLFNFGALPSRIVFNNDVPAIDVLDKYKLQLESAASAYWVTHKKEKTEPARPPLNISQSMLAAEKFPLPYLVRIVPAPVYSKNGNLIITPGYNAESYLYYHPGNLKINRIPEKPSTGDVKTAKALVEQIFQDFPFSSDADRAHAWAAMFVIPCRDMMGNVPATVYESPEAGSGKGLLCECSLHPFAGGNIEKFTPTGSEEEQRKRYTAALETAKPVFMLDNYNDLTGAQTAAILTTDIWSDRRLGEGRIVNLPVKAQFVVTGNNITFSTELARRVVRCRIEAKVDRPWLRTGFKIENLTLWVHRHRAELVEAILVLTQSWIAAGRPQWKGKPLGSYFEWSYIIGGILEHIGVNGFLGNILDVYEKADMEGKSIREFVSEWWTRHGAEGKKSIELFPITATVEGLPIEGKDNDARHRSFSRFMAKQRDRIFTIDVNESPLTLQIVEAGKSKRASLYELQPL